MTRYMTVKCDGEITAEFQPMTGRICLIFGSALIDIAVDEVEPLSAALAQALALSTVPLCPECNGRKLVRIDGGPRMCMACDFTGFAQAEGGAR